LKKGKCEKMETINILGSEIKVGSKNNAVFPSFVFDDKEFKALPPTFQATKLATLDVDAKGHVTNLKYNAQNHKELKKVFTAIVGDSKKDSGEKLDTEMVTVKVDALKIKIMNTFNAELAEIRDMRNRVRTIDLTLMSGKMPIAISTDAKTKTAAGNTDYLGNEIETNGWSRGSYKVDSVEAEILEAIKNNEAK
tara:strand:+ start:2545 stop:3126 length:582 start_codon:yes stop_codon:yes gene_type:complete